MKSLKIRMKICFFNCTEAWGGGEKWHLDHALALNDDGHEVVVVSNHHGELLRRASLENLKTKAFTIKNLSSLNPLKVWQIFVFFKTEKFDILVMNFSKDIKIAAPLAKLVGISKIIYRRGSAIPIKNTAVNRFLFGKCLTHILANSEKTKETILEKNPSLFPADKITVIYNGIKTDNYQNIHFENEIPVIGNIGRLVYQKRQDILLDVAGILKEKGIKCKFRIGGEGILMKELKEKVIKNKFCLIMWSFQALLKIQTTFYNKLIFLHLPPNGKALVTYWQKPCSQKNRWSPSTSAVIPSWFLMELTAI
jgi:glycosyltransferase involved in cell wall biosynthesis